MPKPQAQPVSSNDNAIKQLIYSLLSIYKRIIIRGWAIHD